MNSRGRRPHSFARFGLLLAAIPATGHGVSGHPVILRAVRFRQRLAQLVGLTPRPDTAQVQAEEASFHSALGITEATLARRTQLQHELEKTLQTRGSSAGGGGGVLNTVRDFYAVPKFITGIDFFKAGSVFKGEQSGGKAKLSLQGESLNSCGRIEWFPLEPETLRCSCCPVNPRVSCSALRQATTHVAPFWG